MVYVFGIEGVPLFEMMFVLMLLMIAGLVFIFLELYKLRNLLTEEQSDISRFEQDLSKFETEKTNTEPSGEIVDYIKNAKMQGIQPDQIEQTLVAQGWDKGQVDQILSQV